MVDLEEMKVVGMDMKVRYRLIDGTSSEMAMDIEEGRYDCEQGKGHTESTFFRPVHHIPKKKRTHDFKLQGSSKKGKKKKLKRRIEN